jgi:hypothetical protein
MFPPIMPLRQPQLAVDRYVGGDIFKNVLLCQLDVRKAILKSVWAGPPRFEQKHFVSLEVLKKFGVNPKRRSIQSRGKIWRMIGKGVGASPLGIPKRLR